jgi:hypothetical protein
MKTCSLIGSPATPAMGSCRARHNLTNSLKEAFMKTNNAGMFLRATVLFAVAAFGGNIMTEAQTCSVTWTGNAGTGLWSTAGNWSPRRVPGPASDVCIPLLTTANATPPISIHSLQISQGGGLIIESGKAGASFSVATSLNNQGLIQLYGAALSAGSIAMTDPSNFGSINVYNTSSITSPALSNTTGTVYVGATGTLKLTDNPVQLQNGNLSGGNWLVDDTGLLIVPSDISEMTGGPGGAYYTVLSITSGGSLQDTSGNNPLATVTSVGSYAVLEVPSLTLNDLACQGSVNVGSTLTVSGTFTLESGCTASAGTLTVSGAFTVPSGASAAVGSLLNATSVVVESGGTLSPGGTVNCSITNNGTVSPGIVTVMGNYSQSAGAALTELFGNGTLNVKQNATLSGALNVEVNPKHPPKSGAQYTALTAGSLSGSFTSHTAGFTLTTSANGVLVTKQ